MFFQYKNGWSLFAITQNCVNTRVLAASHLLSLHTSSVGMADTQVPTKLAEIKRNAEEHVPAPL